MMASAAASSLVDRRPRMKVISLAGVGSGAALGAIAVYAYWLRYRYCILAGGLEGEYLHWAMTKYYGGLTAAYWNSSAAVLEGAWSGMARAYPPGYPALIALAKLAGVSDLQQYRLVQIGIDSAGTLLAYAVVRRLGAGTAAGLFAALIYAIAPSWAWSSGVILAESMLPVLTLGALLILLFVADRHRVLPWFVAGLSLGLLPLVRAEMTLFFLPLILWALIKAGGSWRARSICAAAAFLGFALPWSIVAAANFYVFGQFFVTNNASGYAFFSGLGQIPNPYGYVTDDRLAGELLASKGLAYHSPDSERYWWSVYWDAWRQHPGHVVDTIRYRWDMILWFVELPFQHFTAFREFVEYGPVLLLLASGVLILRRQYACVLLILGPLGYALATNGLMYVEPRYIRYAQISYLLAAGLVLDGVLASLDWLRRYLPSRLSWAARPAAAIIAAMPLLVWTARESAILDRAALHVLYEPDLRRLRAGPEGPRALAAERWFAVVPGASVAEGAGQTIVLTSERTSGYQAMSEIGTRGIAALRIDYDIAVKGRQASIGVLSGDAARFYGMQPLPPGQRIVDALLTGVGPPQVFLVLQSTTKDRTEVVLNAVRTSSICADLRPELARSATGWLKATVFPREDDWPLHYCAN
jgi:4-amino-4-deoxy-L-arabinose transferase-like glycosyltransferase